MSGEPWPWPGLEPAKYRAILIDPPWKFSGGTKGRPQHYPRMTDAEIAALPLRQLAHPDGCWVLAWITSPLLLRATKVIQHWGCRYSGRGWVWVKTNSSPNGQSPALFIHPKSIHMGHGYTTRKNAEDCLLYKFGRPKRTSKSVGEIIVAPRREHSRKPDEIFDRVEEFCAGPYADVFSREARPGWDRFGNEADKFTSKGD